MAKYVVLIFILFALLIWGLRIDDALSPQAEALQAKWQLQEKSEAYLYLMGIMANSKEDPILVGRERLKEEKKAELAYRMHGEDFQFYQYPAEKQLPLPEGDLICNFWDKDCLATIHQHSQQIDALLKQHQILLKRYQTYLQFNDFATLFYPFLMEPYPHYSYLVKGNDLVILDAFNAAQNSRYAYALNQLKQNIGKQRKQLSKQDNLIGKMAYLVMISKNLDMAYLISQQAPEEFHFMLEPLQADEKDFTHLMAREYILTYETFKEMIENPESWDDNFIEGWMAKFMHKPNMTINTIYPIYQRTIDLAQMSPQEFSKSVTTANQIPLKFSLLRNFGAKILYGISTPDFNVYVGRMFDLNAKISLYNALIKNKPLDTIYNPYYGASETAYLTDDQKSVCFKGPLEQHRDLRCLRIKP